jgi:hypothetical protein
MYHTKLVAISKRPFFTTKIFCYPRLKQSLEAYIYNKQENPMWIFGFSEKKWMGLRALAQLCSPKTKS